MTLENAIKVYDKLCFYGYLERFLWNWILREFG
jgi:hypothetical protein